MAKIKLFPFEVFKKIELHHSLKLNYAVSNKGRLVSYSTDILEGNIIKGSLINGYQIFRYKIYEEGKITNKHKMYAKLVAEYFMPQPTENQKFVLHKDFNKVNNAVENLFWANNAECIAHGLNSPLYAEARLRAEARLQPLNAKLNVAKVKIIKRMLASPNQTRQKMIAKQFGVTATQIKRIQRGENWAKVTI